MERGLIFDQEPARVLDLGTGYSNVHLNIEQVTVQETDIEGNVSDVVKYKSDVIRIANPATEENILKQAKEQMIAEIQAYDKSDKVNQFTVQGQKIWVYRELRAVLKMRLEAEKAAGKTETTLWYNDLSFSLPIVQAEQILQALELYAAESYDVTAQHIVNVSVSTTADEVVNYNFRTGYPTKLEF